MGRKWDCFEDKKKANFECMGSTQNNCSGFPESTFASRQFLCANDALAKQCKVASDLRFRAAISEPETPFCGIVGDLAPSTQKSLGAVSHHLPVGKKFLRFGLV